MSANNLSNDQTVSMGDWILTMILSGIPIVGIIMLFVWAFGGGAKLSKQNYARAVLLLAVIGFVIGTIFTILAVVLGAFASSDIFNNFSSYSRY